MATNHLQRPHYDNAVLVHPSGQLMTTISLDKVEWYLNKGLANLVEVPGYSKAIQLRFKPKGNDGDATDLIPMANQCVVCGRTDTISAHHVVPYSVKKHYPTCDKTHTRRQVVLLCEKHHLEIEELNRQIAPNPFTPIEGHLKWINKLVGRYTQWLKKWTIRYWRWRKGGVKAINQSYIRLFMTMKPQFLPKDWLQP